MKKMAIVLGAAAALAAVISCAPVAIPQDAETEPVLYTENGQRLVNLSIPTGNLKTSKSLTEDLAKAAVDYYEVVFYNDTEDKYYRTSGVKGRTLKISVPVGDYDNSADKAVIFAGTNNEKTLLATGVISATSDGGVGSQEITSATTSVTFELTALEAAIFDDAASAFQVTFGGYETSGSNHYTKTIGGKTYPYFQIPRETDNITAELEFTGLPAANLILATADPQLNSASVIRPSDAQVLVGLENDTGGILDAGFLTTANNLVKIKISTNLDAITDGWAAISFDIPVIAIHADAGGDLWHVLSGISYTLDRGESTGSCILLQVGNPLIDIITVGP
jgi:hypothetical protein